jgi:hypothetical protein
MLLLPAGIVALLVFGALAFDLSRLWMARRELADLAGSAANDAAAVALDPGVYRSGGGIALSDARADTVVAEVIAAAGLAGRVRGDAIVIADGPNPRVVVVLETEVTSLFARSLPEGWERETITVDSSALLDIF